VNRTLTLPSECDSVLIDEATIAARVAELGAELSADYAGVDLRLVTVLRGGLFFLADLCRQISCDMRLDFLAVAPYQPGGGSSVRVTKDLDDDIAGASVVLVEDIVDTGYTLRTILDLLRFRGAKSVKLCALLDKKAAREVAVPIDYRGFEIGNEFVVGYGLDFDEKYRNLPYIAVYEGPTGN